METGNVSGERPSAYACTTFGFLSFRGGRRFLVLRVNLRETLSQEIPAVLRHFVVEEFPVDLVQNSEFCPGLKGMQLLPLDMNVRHA